MKHIILIFFLFTIGKLVGGDIAWHHGSVVLKNRTVLVGEVTSQQHHDVILFKDGEQVTVLPAHKIISAQFYDEAANINRKYISVASRGYAFQTYTLYEVVIRGTVSVLRKEKALTHIARSDADDYNYFVKDNSALVPLMKFRAKVYPMLVRTGEPMLSMFVLDHRLSPNQPADALTIIQYYNAMILDDKTLARN